MKTAFLFTALALMIMSVTSRYVYDAARPKEMTARKSPFELRALQVAKRRDAFVKALMAERDDEEPVPEEKYTGKPTEECKTCYSACIGAHSAIFCREFCACPDDYSP